MSRKINIIGAGGHAKVVIEIAELLNYDIDGIFDQNENIKTILNYPVSHNPESLSDQANIFYALGSNFKRKKNAENFRPADINLIHPSAIVSKRIKMGIGNVIMPGVIINSSTIIGNHCIINTGASVDHDCEIEDYVHISPNAALAGNIKVMEGAQIGIGASLKQNVKIGKWSVVGAGSVVISDVPDNVVVVGNPARYLKMNIL